MIQKTLKTTTGKLLVKMPERLNEITLGQLMAMQDSSKLTDLQAISILSGAAPEDLQNISDVNDLQLFSEQVLSIAGQIKYLYNSEAVPRQTTFMIDGKPATVKVIKNLSIEPAGAFMAAREVITEEINDHIKRYGEAGW